MTSRPPEADKPKAKEPEEVRCPIITNVSSVSHAEIAMPLYLNIGTDSAPEEIDLEKVNVITVCDDPSPQNCWVSFQRVNGQDRVVRGNHVKRVIHDLSKASEQNPSLRRIVVTEPGRH